MIHDPIETVRQMFSGFIGDGCWHWPLSKMRSGYGQLSRRINGKQVVLYAHRLSYEAAYGEIPKGMYVCHKCDTRDCFNPTHLFLGTHSDNMRDMAQKGRTNKGKTFPIGKSHWAAKNPHRVRGTNNARAKLTEEQVRQIFQSAEKGTLLARRFDVTQTLISRICHGKAWPHVTRV